LTYRKTGHRMVVDLATGPVDEAASAQIAAEFADLCDLIAWDEETRVVALIFGGETHPALPAFVARLKQPVIAAIREDAIGSTRKL